MPQLEKCLVQMLLLDSLQKRCKFVKNVISHLDIPNAEVLWSRAEDAGHQKQLREVRLSIADILGNSIPEKRLVAVS